MSLEALGYGKQKQLTYFIDIAQDAMYKTYKVILATENKKTGEIEWVKELFTVNPYEFSKEAVIKKLNLKGISTKEIEIAWPEGNGGR